MLTKLPAQPKFGGGKVKPKKSGLATAGGAMSMRQPRAKVPGLNYLDPGLMPENPGNDLSAILKLFGAPPAPMAPDPYDRPLSPQQMRQQATSYVSASTVPLLQEIERIFARQGKRASSEIQGYTDWQRQAMAELTPGVDKGYADAQQDSATSDAALAAYLNDQGSKDYQELAAKLGQAGAPQASLDAAAGQTTGAAGMAAGSSLAEGNATMQQLLGQGASEHAYSSKMPAIATMSGARTLKNTERQYADALDQQVGQVRAQAPGLAADFLQTLLGREDSKAGRRQQATLSGRQDQQQFTRDRASAAASTLESSRNRNFQGALARQGLSTDLDDRAYQREKDAYQRSQDRETNLLNRQQFLLSKAQLTSNEKIQLAQVKADLVKTQAANQQWETEFNYGVGKDNAAFDIDWFNALTSRQNANTSAANPPSTSNATTPEERASRDRTSGLTAAEDQGGKLAKGMFTKTTSKITGKTTTSAPTYQAAFKRLHGSLAPRLSRLGLKPAEIKQEIDSILSGYGIVPQAPPHATSSGQSQTFPFPTHAW